MGNYDLLLLEGAGSARGINSDGVVVGSALASDGAHMLRGGPRGSLAPSRSTRNRRRLVPQVGSSIASMTTVTLSGFLMASLFTASVHESC
jgi:hypothetical protein